jgi:hypothetical protein
MQIRDEDLSVATLPIYLFTSQFLLLSVLKSAAQFTRLSALSMVRKVSPMKKKYKLEKVLEFM